MWLDADFKGARSRNSRGKRLGNAINEAKAMLAKVDEGQVGIYDQYCGNRFYGYVIKYPGELPYFEDARYTEETA